MMKEDTNFRRRRIFVEDQPFDKKDMLMKNLQEDAKRFASFLLEYNTATVDMMVRQQEYDSALSDAFSPPQIKKQSAVRAEGLYESFLEVLLSETNGWNKTPNIGFESALASDGRGFKIRLLFLNIIVF
jgi:hypothetical protein